MQFLPHDRPLTARDKGKMPARDDHDSANGSFPNTPSSSHYYPSRSPPSLHSTTTTNSRRSRGSIIVAASDALNTFRFGRRHKSLRQAKVPVQSLQTGLILPDVIEISAATARIIPDEDVQERDRLRDVAAQSIGLGPVLLQVNSPVDSLDDEGIEVQDVEVQSKAHIDLESVDAHTLPPSPTLSSAHPPKALLQLTHSRTNSSSFSPTTTSNTTTSTSHATIPPFPSTPANLAHHTQKSAILPKFYPPSSLRIFALNGKQWKPRHIVLTSPPSFSVCASYLHLFKATKKGNDETSKEPELERLEINENSVVFIADEEFVGGRKGVIKVGGVDVGITRRHPHILEENEQTMWILQIVDPLEAQNWIEMIKHNILQLRSMKAGLGSLKQTPGGIEPKGDMDVMLSLRAQNLYVPPQLPSSAPSSTTHLPRRTSRPSTSPQAIASHKSLTNSAHSSLGKPASITSTSSHSRALKGLFATRSRSPSAASAPETSGGFVTRPHTSDDSFGSMGTSLLSMMRPGNSKTSASTFGNTSQSSTESRHDSLKPNGIANRHLSLQGSAKVLDRKISPAGWNQRSEQSTSAKPSLSTATASSTTLRASNRNGRALSLQAMPLQPPPRKRWTSIGPANPQEALREADLPEDERTDEMLNGMYNNAKANGSLSAVGFGPLAESNGSSLSTPRAPSVHSVSVSIQSASTLASADFGSHSTNTRPSFETKRSSRRWSRQSTLPRRTTPPNGPPPATPPGRPPSQHSHNSAWIQQAQPTISHPYANGGASDDARPESRLSAHSNESEKSVISGLPSFSKRISMSSAVSTGTNSTSSHNPPSVSAASHPPVHLRPGSSHRVSMPPPRGPAPTFALPPAPLEMKRRDSEPPVPSADVLAGPTTTSTTATVPATTAPKSLSFRDRAFRLSLMAPLKPPPSIVLPPRPDDAEIDSVPTNHERSATVRAPTGPEPLSPIPASPVPPPLQAPAALNKPASSNLTASRHTSIKKRLRILSAPTSAPFALVPSTPPTANTTFSQLPQSVQSSLTLEHNSSASSFPSAPGTPIAEHITPPHIQNDPSFIQTPLPSPMAANYFPESMDPAAMISKSPPPRSLPSPPPLPPPEQEEEYPELQSLSPPPRRASKQLSVNEIKEGPIASVVDQCPEMNEKNGAAIQDQALTADIVDIIEAQEKEAVLGENLSKHGSVISLGIVSM